MRIELRLDVSPLLVSVTRRFVEEALEKVITDGDLISRVAMTTHELLENAAKYAYHGEAELAVVMSAEHEQRLLTVELRNETSPAHIDRLKSIFTELDDAADPMVLYIKLMRRNAHAAGTSGLGLARIRAEGEMALSLKVDGAVATITARTPVSSSSLA